MDTSERRNGTRTLRELREDDRPREKLLAHGPGGLTDAELVAIALGSGLPGQNVLDLAQEVLQRLGGLDGLSRADAKQLQQLDGIGPAKAAQLSACIEVARRLKELKPEDRPMLTSAAAVFTYFGGQILGLPSETLFIMSLDTRGRLLGSPSKIKGGVDSVVARAADVYRDAIILRASSVVLAHNHPSGDPRPSPQDIRVTTDLAAAGELFDIQLLDHVVFGQNRYVSMRDESLAFRGQRPARR